jgi:hypothetical protein
MRLQYAGLETPSYPISLSRITDGVALPNSLVLEHNGSFDLELVIPRSTTHSAVRRSPFAELNVDNSKPTLLDEILLGGKCVLLGSTQERK